MLIINADDFGRNCLSSDRILACHQEGRVTSTSAMVFMQDSERAATLGRASGIDIGLHLNFTERFSHNECPGPLARDQSRIVRFLKSSRYSFLLYHPALKKAFRDVFQGQIDEFHRLYERAPSHFDGHHHMHLCSNVLMQQLIPKGAKVRRHFFFRPGEKSGFNRCYRAVVNKWLNSRYRCTDFLFPITLCYKEDGFERVLSHAVQGNVELETHPENPAEFDWLRSEVFLRGLSSVVKGTYAHL